MKILPTLLLMLLPFYVFGVYGCSDDNSGDEQIQKFTLAEVDLQQNFTKEKGELSIPVSTTLDASRWDVASNQDWCIAAKDLSTSKPSIKILVKASEEPEIREAVVTVKSLVKNYEIHVKHSVEVIEYLRRLGNACQVSCQHNVFQRIVARGEKTYHAYGLKHHVYKREREIRFCGDVADVTEV